MQETVERGTQYFCVEPEGTVNDGVIEVHRYNATLSAEFMSTSVSNIMYLLFWNGCNMTQLYRTLPEILTTLNQWKHLPRSTMKWPWKNDCIAVANNLPGLMVMWVDHTIWFKTNSDMLNNDNNIN